MSSLEQWAWVIGLFAGGWYGGANASTFWSVLGALAFWEWLKMRFKGELD